MPRGKRKFVLEITDTEALTTGDLERALSGLAGAIHSGRASIESGCIRNKAGKVIGGYKWVDQMPQPVPHPVPRD